MTYGAGLSDRALKQMHGLPGPACDSLIEAMAEIIDPAARPRRAADPGESGLTTAAQAQPTCASHQMMTTERRGGMPSGRLALTRW